MPLVIVDTGCANLASVKFAFERLGINASITDKADEISSADRIILPGVGAAPFAMKAIEGKGLTETLKKLTQPVLGICLGMQILFDQLEEGGEITKGLGLISGTVNALDSGTLPAPHMGWNKLTHLKGDPLLSGINESDYAYFVHSYAAPISEATLAQCEYGQDFSAIVRRGNVWGCQFHPERSAKLGAQILKNFTEITL